MFGVVCSICFVSTFYQSVFCTCLEIGFEIEISDRVKLLFNEHAKGSRFQNNLNVTAFKEYINDSIDPSIDIKFIEDGYPLHLSTDGSNFEPIALCQKPASFARSKREIIAILVHIIKELQKGQIISSKSPPKYILNLFTVPKKDSEAGLMTKLRFVRHRSFKTATTTSINGWSDQQKCKMPTLPNLKDYVKLLIDSDWMALRDLSDAFR